MTNLEHNIILYILQIVSIYNALTMGWKVKKIGINKYEFSRKNIIVNDFNLNEFINNIISISIINNAYV
jgi:hypothetical protein